MTHKISVPCSKRVRICLSARLRANWSAIVEVPADASQQELADLARDFNHDIDGGEYTDDNEYWENNDPDVEHDVDPEEQSHYRAIRKDGGLVWRELDEPDESDDDVEGSPAESKITGNSTKKPYRVWVRDNRQILFIIDAVNAAQARRIVEASEDADEEFGGTIDDSQWYIEQVELASTA